MECPKCRTVSLPGSQFCEKCGYNLKALRARESDRRGGHHTPVPAMPPMPAPGPAPRPAPAPTPRPAAAPAPAPRPQTPPPTRPATSAPRQAPVAAPAPAPAPPAPPPVKVFALLTARDLPGLRFELSLDRTEIGRQSLGEGIDPQVDLSAADTTGSVSRRHALITREESFVVLEDRGSSNGTFVNGARLTPGLQKNLEDNDEICFGSLAFRFHRK